jgi:cyanophycinase
LMSLTKQVLSATMVLIVSSSMMLFSLPASGEQVTYEYYVKGNPDDVVTQASGGLLLAGGSNDIPSAMAWMTAKSGGGDFVVIRCSGTDAYNPWIYSNIGGVDSCETIIFLSSKACEDEFVLSKIRSAEALFIAGGDQWDYVKMWKGTPVEDAIHEVAAKPAPVGGTSAGLAVLGEFSFSAEFETIESTLALSNPCSRKVAIEDDFLHLSTMEGVITDSHFVARDRMGRLITFMARIVQDGLATEARGIGINEKTALGVEPNGAVVVFGLRPDICAYFLSTPGLPERCEPNTPLTFLDISVYRVTETSTFNLTTWQGSGGTAYTLSAVEGLLESSQPNGAIY